MSTPAEVSDAVVRAHYERLMAAPDAARARAQAAYGIASAIALAIVAAGLFGGLDGQPIGVQAVAVAALIAWLATAALFLHAVSSPFEMGPRAKSSKDAIVEATLDEVRNERIKIDVWQRRAQLAAAVAALLTVTTFVIALCADDGQTEKTATIAITAASAGRLAAACGSITGRLVGKLSEASLDEKFVDITLDPGMCGPASVHIALPRSAILALAFRSSPTR